MEKIKHIILVPRQREGNKNVVPRMESHSIEEKLCKISPVLRNNTGEIRYTLEDRWGKMTLVKRNQVIQMCKTENWNVKKVRCTKIVIKKDMQSNAGNAKKVLHSNEK